jgi:ubiquinone/menaquinone biosynthesis C-methylase UbiE
MARIQVHTVAAALALTIAAWAFQPKSSPGNPSTLEDFKTGDATREPYQNATGLVAALEIVPGDWVADVGAGAGYYSMKFSEAVGPNGKVFAEDISDSAMRWLHSRVQLFDLRNVEIVKGEITDPKLPANRLSAILVIDSYHHFVDSAAMLNKIFQSLKPGGRLAIADYSFRDHRTQPRADQLKLHELDPLLVRDELTSAGFTVSKFHDPFVKWVPGVGNTRASPTDLWLIVAIRPK